MRKRCPIPLRLLLVFGLGSIAIAICIGLWISTTPTDYRAHGIEAEWQEKVWSELFSDLGTQLWQRRVRLPQRGNRHKPRATPGVQPTLQAMRSA
jgi:hypothetical protein